MSSTFGRSLRSFSPNRIRNSLVVAYMNGRPTTCLRPTILIRCRSSSVLSTPDVLTPRISPISSAVIGCLYAMTASVSSACTDSFCVVRSWNSRRTHSCRSGRVTI